MGDVHRRPLDRLEYKWQRESIYIERRLDMRSRHLKQIRWVAETEVNRLPFDVEIVKRRPTRKRNLKGTKKAG
jgi:hypothetical protein